jgi:ribosomal-protein-serine acetyltransferase
MEAPHPAHPIAPPTLTDGVVMVRPWQRRDAPALFEAARESIATVGAWLPWLDETYKFEDAEIWTIMSDAHWHGGLEYRFAIFEAGAHGRLLGGVGLNQINRPHRVGNLGYWVRASATGRGVATRAARLVARFGLTTAELGRIEILTATDNLASQRVADKIGATFEGVLRERLLTRGERVPARLYSLIGRDVRESPP